MEIRTAIEVEAYGDFDMPYTKEIMVSDQQYDVKNLVNSYCSLRGLDSTSGLPYNMISDTTDDFIKYLKKEGFRPLKTKKVSFSD